MRVILDRDSLSDTQRVVAIGNFDGLHRGHKELLLHTRELGFKRNLPTATLSFDPHPLAFFSHKNIKFLFTKDMKTKALKAAGIDDPILLKFDQSVADLSPSEFVSKILHDTLHTKVILVGEGFKFGRNRQGGFGDLVEECKKVGIEAHSIPHQLDQDEQKISSTTIRKQIESGDFSKAISLLGHPYILLGKTKRGKQLGRKLGYPTLNLGGINQTMPAEGTYYGRINIDQNDFDGILKPSHNAKPCLISIGSQPTFADQRSGDHCEIHIVDQTLSEDLYDIPLQVFVEEFIRPQKRFSSTEELKSQIDKDAEYARSLCKKSR